MSTIVYLIPHISKTFQFETVYNSRTLLSGSSVLVYSSPRFCFGNKPVGEFLVFCLPSYWSHVTLVPVLDDSWIFLIFFVVDIVLVSSSAVEDTIPSLVFVRSSLVCWSLLFGVQCFYTYEGFWPCNCVLSSSHRSPSPSVHFFLILGISSLFFHLWPWQNWICRWDCNIIAGNLHMFLWWA